MFVKERMTFDEVRRDLFRLPGLRISQRTAGRRISESHRECEDGDCKEWLGHRCNATGTRRHQACEISERRDPPPVTRYSVSTAVESASAAPASRLGRPPASAELAAKT